MSLSGVKQTCSLPLRVSAIGVKRTSLIAAHMSANDPKRTSIRRGLPLSVCPFDTIRCRILSLGEGNATAQTKLKKRNVVRRRSGATRRRSLVVPSFPPSMQPRGLRFSSTGLRRR